MLAGGVKRFQVKTLTMSFLGAGVLDSNKSDLISVSSDTDGTTCKVAAFLSKFIPPETDWLHLDTAGITRTSGRTFTYLRRGMSGRPTRTVIEFLSQLACVKETEEPRT